MELPCHVSQGHPTPTVKSVEEQGNERFIRCLTRRWLHNQMELRLAPGKTDRKHLLSSANSLLILQTEKSDNGNYRCVISNEAGEDMIDVYLDVHGNDASLQTFSEQGKRLPSSALSSSIL